MVKVFAGRDDCDCIRATMVEVDAAGKTLPEERLPPSAVLRLIAGIGA